MSQVALGSVAPGAAEYVCPVVSGAGDPQSDQGPAPLYSVPLFSDIGHGALVFNAAVRRIDDNFDRPAAATTDLKIRCRLMRLLLVKTRLSLFAQVIPDTAGQALVPSR